MDIALIPARGGSKRIPGKNIRPFRGRPMIAWSLKAAADAGIFEHVVVSTDDEAIAAVARAEGATSVLERPTPISGDRTPLADVIPDALTQWAREGIEPTRICLLLATAPFVTGSDLVAGRDALLETRAPSAFAVTTFPFPIDRALLRAEDGSVTMRWPQHELTPSQALPEGWHDAGWFYWLDVAAFRETGRLYAAGAQGVAVPRHRVQDIDTEEDWTRAELMHRVLEEGDATR